MPCYAPLQAYGTVGHVLEISADERLSILLGESGPRMQQYLLSLIDLLSTCAEGENRCARQLVVLS